MLFAAMHVLSLMMMVPLGIYREGFQSAMNRIFEWHALGRFLGIALLFELSRMYVAKAFHGSDGHPGMTASATHTHTHSTNLA